MWAFDQWFSMLPVHYNHLVIFFKDYRCTPWSHPEKYLLNIFCGRSLIPVFLKIFVVTLMGKQNWESWMTFSLTHLPAINFKNSYNKWSENKFHNYDKILLFNSLNIIIFPIIYRKCFSYFVCTWLYPLLYSKFCK